MHFRIADLDFEILPDELACIHSSLSSFRSRSNSAVSSDISITLLPTRSSISKPSEEIVLNDLNKWILYNDKDHSCCVYQCSCRDPENEPIIKSVISANWKDIQITYLAENQNVLELVMHTIGQVILKNSILFHRGIIIHAAAIKCDGLGILFTAPSGVGKSTQADLWEKEKGAIILNDDIPAIRILDSGPRMYGTPWCGSRGLYKNDSADIKAIIFLHQGAINNIERLSSYDAIPLLLPRCLLPYHDKCLMDLALETIERVVQKVSIYNFYCTPDRDAVRILSQWIE